MLVKHKIALSVLTSILISYLICDVLVVSYLIGRGSFLNFCDQILNDIENYNFIDSYIEFFCFSLYRLSFTMGIFIGYCVGGSMGKYTLRIHNIIIVLLLVFPMTKLLAYSERELMNDIYFWLLFTWSSLTSIIFYAQNDFLMYMLRLIGVITIPNREQGNYSRMVDESKNKMNSLLHLLSYTKPDILYIATAIIFMVIASVC